MDLNAWQIFQNQVNFALFWSCIWRGLLPADNLRHVLLIFRYLKFLFTHFVFFVSQMSVLIKKGFLFSLIKQINIPLRQLSLTTKLFKIQVESNICKKYCGLIEKITSKSIFAILIKVSSQTEKNQQLHMCLYTNQLLSCMLYLTFK